MIPLKGTSWQLICGSGFFSLSLSKASRDECRIIAAGKPLPRAENNLLYKS